MRSYSLPAQEQAFVTALATVILPCSSRTAQGYSGQSIIILLPPGDLPAIELGSGQRERWIGKDISLPLIHRNCVSSIDFTRSSLY